MSKRSKAAFIALPLQLLAGVAVFLLCCNQEGFTGSRVKNPDAYLLDIQRMNGTDLHTLELQKGDVLHIRFETAKGDLYMEIKAPDGMRLYRGNGKEITDFTVNIPESGVYAIVVEARQAKGTIHIQCEKGTFGEKLRKNAKAYEIRLYNKPGVLYNDHETQGFADGAIQYVFANACQHNGCIVPACAGNLRGNGRSMDQNPVLKRTGTDRGAGNETAPTGAESAQAVQNETGEDVEWEGKER